MNDKSIYRLSPKKSRTTYRPHKIVYNAFSRPSSLQMSINSSANSVTVYMFRDVEPTKKGARLRQAISAMMTNPDMLRALLADALGHAAMKGAEERLGSGWQVEQLDIQAPDLSRGQNRVSGVARLKRFIS